MSTNVIRKRFTYRGIIQGVGFRPTIYRAAVSLGLSGYVQNRRSVVVAELEGTEEKICAFSEALQSILPDAAEIESINVEDMAPIGEKSFTIIESQSSDYTFPPIPPDLSICSTCRVELYEKKNRRYLYPFITCTQCGPRYSIVEDTPFDRETTSMIDFPQCPNCMKEYTNPLDRRFHSQTNSCEICGPQLILQRADKSLVEGNPVLNTIEALKNGSLVAIQGIGGFHLAVFPGFEDTVRKLRLDKERERKPFALMVRDVEEAKTLCTLTENDEKILTSTESPILILPEKPGTPTYLSQVSDTGTLGIMHPYTPLQLLLFDYPGTEVTYRHLIMTSANWQGEPILTDAADVFDRLGNIVDFVLSHNRRIVFRNDDSVLRSLENNTSYLRRSRGYVPRIITLPNEIQRTTLAVGGDLKSAPAFALGQDIYLSPYIGDLENSSTYSAFQDQITKILSLYNVEPEKIVYDLHPAYYSTKWAESQEFPVHQQVQHHHAHILSVMAEHSLEESLGLAFDGTGFGPDGTIWGGEFLFARRDSFTRIGRFKPFPLPGGDQAVLHPMRIVYGMLITSGYTKKEINNLVDPIDGSELLADMIAKKINSPLTSSLGRVFDAASVLLGTVDTVSYEGEGPIRLEGLAMKAWKSQDPAKEILNSLKLFPVAHPLPSFSSLNSSVPLEQLLFEIDSIQMINYLIKNKNRMSLEELALLFHHAVAAAAVEGAQIMKAATNIETICLSGGVFQNMLLRSLLIPRLQEAGFRVYTNQSIPPGDGGIAVGQAYATCTSEIE